MDSYEGLREPEMQEHTMSDIRAEVIGGCSSR